MKMMMEKTNTEENIHQFKLEQLKIVVCIGFLLNFPKISIQKYKICNYFNIYHLTQGTNELSLWHLWQQFSQKLFLLKRKIKNKNYYLSSVVGTFFL